jgi:SAM-dependent methyltransferase
MSVESNDDPRLPFYRSLRSTLESVVGAAKVASARDILEFGCGKRGLLDLYKGRGQTATGVDIHNYRAHWEPRGIHYSQSDGRHVPLPDASFDLVISHSVMEHVDDVDQCVFEIDRLTRTRGIIYITVSPLYFSPTGSHNRALPDWEHLRPGSEHYMMDKPLEKAGAHLNKLTCPRMLAAVGRVPWDILLFKRTVLRKEMPEFLRTSGIPAIDHLTREFRLVARKISDSGKRQSG